MILVRLVEAMGGAAVACLVFAIVKRRLGPLTALVLSLLVLFMGSAWEITLTQSGITYVWSVALGLGALVALDHGSERGDAIACALLVLAIAMFTFGLAFLIGAGLLLILRPNWTRRIWVLAVPVGLYAIWAIWVRTIDLPQNVPIQQLHLDKALHIPGFWVDESVSVAGAMSGLSHGDDSAGIFSVFSTSSPIGAPLAALAWLGLVVGIVRGRATPWLWAMLATMLAIWAELALGEGLGRSAETVRYVYVGAVFAVIIAAELLRGARLHGLGLAALIVVVGLALAGNAARARDGIDFYRDFTISLRAAQTALEIGRDSIPPDYGPSEPTSAGFTYLKLATYEPAVERVGSPAFTEAELLDQPEDVRATTDSVLATAYGLTLAPPADRPPRASCDTVAASESGPVEVPLPPPGAVLTSEAAAPVEIRRFADTTTIDLGDLKAGDPAQVGFPADRSTRPWVLSIAATKPVTVCPLVPAAG